MNFMHKILLALLALTLTFGGMSTLHADTANAQPAKTKKKAKKKAKKKTKKKAKKKTKKRKFQRKVAKGELQQTHRVLVRARAAVKANKKGRAKLAKGIAHQKAARKAFSRKHFNVAAQHTLKARAFARGALHAAGKAPATGDTQPVEEPTPDEIDTTGEEAVEVPEISPNDDKVLFSEELPEVDSL